jgi:hypothetical protein
MLNTSQRQSRKLQLSAKKRWLFHAVQLLLVFVALEVFSYVGLRWLSTRYPMDPMAQITAPRVQSFLQVHYDPNCGWGPPRTRNDINSLGARSLHEYQDLHKTISVYGDSWTFGLGVEIADSWPIQLEKMANCGVLNFGVNGYGTDQALLRLEHTYAQAPSATVLLCITLENINRCVSINQAFYQAKGMAPKPRFVVEGGRVSLLNPFDSPQKVRDLILDHPEKLVALAQVYDYWYQEKTLFGRPWSISFPYSVQMAARMPFLVRRARIGLTDVSAHIPLYHDEQTFAVMRGILRRYRDLAAQKRFTPVVLILPTLREVRRYLATRQIEYQPLHDFLDSESITYVDVLGRFADHADYPALFLHREDHLSPSGCQVVAGVVYQALVDRGAIPMR